MSPRHTSSRLLFAAVAACAFAGGTALFLYARQPQLQRLLPPAAEVNRHATDAVAVGSPSDRRSVRQHLGLHGAAVGSVFTYRLEDRLAFELRTADGVTQPTGTLHVLAAVETTIADRRADEVLVRQSIGELQFLDATGKPTPEDSFTASFAAACAEPVWMQFDARGSVQGFGFPDGLCGDQRNFVRGLLGLFSAQEPPRGERTWRCREFDTTGEFEADHEVVAGADDAEVGVARRRCRYITIAHQDPLPEHEVRGETRITFSDELGWITAVQLDEGLTMRLPLLDLQVISSRRAAVQLLEHRFGSIDLDTADGWRRAAATPAQQFEQTGAYSAAMEEDSWRQRLQGKTVDGILAELAQALACSPVDAAVVDALFRELQWLARLEQGAVDRLRDGVIANDLPAAAVPVAISALGAAGTAPAQSALVALREQPSLTAETRMSATVAALQLESPSPAMMESLWRDACGASDVRESSLLVLGALAGRNSGDLADGRSPLQALLAMEAQAQADGELATWLLALGNTGAPAAFAAVRGYLEHTDPAVRCAACVALRRAAGADVVELLAARALGDAELLVRTEAVRELGRRSDGQSRRALERVAAEERTEELAAKARELLARHG